MALGQIFGGNITFSPVYFQAYRATSNQVIGGAGVTKIQFNAEAFDVGGYFDSTTNYRHTPLIKGLYYYATEISAGAATAMLYKNGTAYIQNNNSNIFDTEALIEMNGTTDYVEVYANFSGATNVVFGTAPYRTIFQGFLIYPL